MRKVAYVWNVFLDFLDTDLASWRAIAPFLFMLAVNFIGGPILRAYVEIERMSAVEAFGLGYIWAVATLTLFLLAGIIAGRGSR